MLSSDGTDNEQRGTAAELLLEALFRRGRGILTEDLKPLQQEQFHQLGDRPVFVALTEVADQAPEYGNFAALLTIVTEHLLNSGQLEDQHGKHIRKTLERIAASTVDEAQVPVLVRAALLERIDRGAVIMAGELKDGWKDMPVDQRGPWLSRRVSHMYTLLEEYQRLAGGGSHGLKAVAS